MAIDTQTRYLDIDSLMTRIKEAVAAKAALGYSDKLFYLTEEERAALVASGHLAELETGGTRVYADCLPDPTKLDNSDSDFVYIWIRWPHNGLGSPLVRSAPRRTRVETAQDNQTAAPKPRRKAKAASKAKITARKKTGRSSTAKAAKKPGKVKRAKKPNKATRSGPELLTGSNAP